MIPLDLPEAKASDFVKSKNVNRKSLEREFTKTSVYTSYMATFSCFLVDLICLYIPLIQYADHSLTQALVLFIEKQEDGVSIFYYCSLVHLLVLYSGILLSLIFKNVMFWDVLRNWVLVGIFLSVLSIAFSRSNFLFRITTLLINLACLRIRVDFKTSED